MTTNMSVKCVNSFINLSVLSSFSSLLRYHLGCLSPQMILSFLVCTNLTHLLTARSFDKKCSRKYILTIQQYFSYIFATLSLERSAKIFFFFFFFFSYFQIVFCSHAQFMLIVFLGVFLPLAENCKFNFNVPGPKVQKTSKNA